VGTGPAHGKPHTTIDEHLRRHALILQNVRESIIVTDLAGTIVAWNAGATALFGYTAEEMLGRTPAVLYPDQDQATLSADLDAIREGRDYRGDWWGRRKDGTPLWIDITTSPFYDEDGVAIGFIGVAHDITARKEAEERYRLLAAATEALVATRDLGETPQRIANLAVPTLADWCAVGVLETDGTLEWRGMSRRDAALAPLIALHGPAADRHLLAIVDDLACAALRTGQTQRVARDVADEELVPMSAPGHAAATADLDVLGTISLVVVPL
jgi:PAS domain S-box-containing protein